jgi:hypothetical protein
MFGSSSENNLSMMTGTAAERREAAEREQQRRAAERRKLIEAQSSPQYDPQYRIELWERLHGLHLPRMSEHQLVHVIAKQTALTVKQVQKEQLRRATVSAESST